MSNYPFSQDNNITLPGVSGTSDEDVAITALREAAFAIETELGIKPSGIYTDVRARLDILESRINGSIPSGVTNDGYILSPLLLWNTSSNVTLSISDGYGVPTENRINGSLFMRADGYANNELYVRRSGAWYPIQTDLWVASGDLSGTYLSQTVIGLQGKSLNSSLATINTFGLSRDGYHLTWNASGQYWEAQTGFKAAGDLAITNSPPWGRTSQVVVGLQNKAIAPAATTPSDGDVLVFETTDNHWEPQQPAVVFGGSVLAGDGYVTRTNIRSNKLLQSPSANTSSKVGMVNFGSRSSGLTAGTTENYAAILSGDRHAASGLFSLITGGDTNTASGQYATVINGTTNTASANYSVVMDGYNNTASGIHSYVLNGSANAPAALYSSVLNGISNTISSTSTHAAIGFGSNNQITGATATYTLIMGGSGNQASAQNVFLGNPTGATVQSTYSTVLTGLNNSINSTSNFSAIISGNTNTVSGSSGFGFIGTGNNITVTGLYATVLNATVATANGLHSLVLNGNTNSVTGSFSTIVNGNNNTISGPIAYGTILDGYGNSVSGAGGLVDGYNNTVSGIWSTILNGNGNSISCRNSTILNGSSNSMDAASSENTILVGTSNVLTGTNNTVTIGSGNTLTNVSSHFVLGSFNTHQSNFSFTNGSLNTSLSGAAFNRIWGSSNTIGTNVTINGIFGNSNALGPTSTTSNNFVVGSSNIVDGYGNSTVLGSTNIANSSFGLVQGQYGKSRMFGQQVHANSRFTAGRVGEAQWSRMVLTGNANSGASIPLLLQDAAPTPITFVDGYSYDLQIRVMVVNTSPITPNPVVPARFVFDVLAHQEAGSIVLDNVNHTVITPNTSDDPSGATRTIGWSVSITTSGNQLQITVDPELSSANYVQPGNTPSNRRAVATVEMREMTRL